MKVLLLSILVFGSTAYAQSLSGFYPSDQQFSDCEATAGPALAERNAWYESQGANLRLSMCVKVSNTLWMDGYFYAIFWGCTDADNGVYNPYQDLATCFHGRSQADVDARYPRTQASTLQSGNEKVPNMCGSRIDVTKKVVAEQIPIDGIPLKLVYSSEFNPNRMINKSIYDEEYVTGFTSFDRVAITNKVSNTVAITPGVSGFPIRLKREWNQIDGNTSIHPALKKSQFSLSYDRKIPVTAGDPTASNLTSLPLRMSYRYCDESYTCAGNENRETGNAKDGTNFWMDGFRKDVSVSVYHPEVWGLAGWTISNHHFFDRDAKIVYLGSGERQQFKNFVTVSISGYGNVDIVSSAALDEIYLFSQTGQHLETRFKKLNALKYKFTYNATSKKLLSFVDIDNKQTVLTYDTSGLLTKITAPYGQETIITANQGTITNVQNSVGQSYGMLYDSNKLLTQFSKPNGEIAVFSYNPDGDFLSEAKNTGQFQSIAESFINGVQSFTKTTAIGIKSIFDVTQIATLTTTEIKNGSGQLISKAEMGDTQKLYSGLNTFDFSNVTETFWGTDVSSDPYISTYRESNVVVDEQIQSQHNYTYSSTTDPRSITNEGKTYGFYGDYDYASESFDAATKTITSLVPQIGTTTYTLNAKLRLTKVVPPVGVQTTFTYDTASKLSKIQKGTSYSNFTYNTFGFLNSIVTSKGQTTGFLTDSQGKILTTTLPNSETIQYEYTNGGSVKKITTPSGQAHNFQTITGDFVTGYLNPAGGQTTYGYDAEKRMNQINYPSGRAVGFSYAAGTDSLLQITTADGNYNFSNTDAQGRVGTIVSSDAMKTEFSWVSDQVQQQKFYDSDGSVIGSISYGYPANRLRANQILLNGSVLADLQFDSYTGRLSWLSLGTSAFTYNYQNNSATSNQVTVANGLGMSVVYEFQDSSSGNKPLRKITASVNESASLPIGITMTRTFDNFGIATDYTTNVLDNTTGKVKSYYQLIPTYDLNNRLTQVQRLKKVYVGTTLTTQTEFYNQYIYPANSNGNIASYIQRPTLVATPTKLSSAVYTVDDRQSSLSGTLNRTYAYTSDGQLSSMMDLTGTTNFTYDDFSNLKQVIYPSGKVVQYKVDGLNRRLKKIVNGVTTEYYLWYDQTRLAAVLDGNKNVILSYVYGPESLTASYVIKNGINYKIIQDPGLGSIRYIIDSSTNVVAQEIEYDELGNMIKNTDPTFQPLGFAGGLVDYEGSGFVRFGARDYDPVTGRWTSKDATGFNSGDTNLYSYVQGNPMSYIDPKGRNPLVIGAILGTGLFVGGVNALGTYKQGGASMSDMLSSFGAGFITGSGAMMAGILTGGVPAAGALGLSLTGAGAAAGVIADLGLTAILAPLTVPASDAAKGVDTVKKSCP